MSFPQWLHKLFDQKEGNEAVDASGLKNREPLTEEDCLASLTELYRFISAGKAGSLALNAAACSDYALILGNLFRSQGDIDRAVRLREAMLSDPAMPEERRAAVLFELGEDYRKAGLYDRAYAAYRDSRQNGYPEEDISQELALLAADSGNFEKAADESAKHGNVQAQAFYLVRLAEESAAVGNDGAAIKLVKDALRIFPGSPEAWLRLACISLLGGDGKTAAGHVLSGIEHGEEPAQLILLEGLYAFLLGGAAPHLEEDALAALIAAIHGFFSGVEAGVVHCYYTGLFLQLVNREKEAEQWFTKALVLDPDFWAARLAILGLSAGREKLPLLLSQQISFLAAQASQAKRFRCASCGMRRDTIFSFCPRCRAWHTAAFRSRFF